MSDTGRRERKKQQTRLALRSAALRLTAERGLDRVTVEAIAEAADVSTRTFFNYFPTKEEAVIGFDLDGMDRLLAALAARPADEAPLTALHAVLHDLAEQLVSARELHELRRRVVADNPSLLPRQVAAFVEFERVLVEAVKGRGQAPAPDAEAHLVVACAVAALRVSVELWLAGRGELPELLDRAVARLSTGFVEPKPNVPPRPPRTTLRKDL